LKVESEVKQGDPVTATLFSMVVDVILRQLDLRGNISTHLKQCLVYDGNILITTKQLLIDMFQKLTNQSILCGLIVNQQNAKYLRCSKKKIGLNDIDKDSKYLEQVKFYKYLGSIVNGDNNIAEEIKERIAVGVKTYYTNPKIFEIKLLSKKTKLQLYWTIKRCVIT